MKISMDKFSDIFVVAMSTLVLIGLSEIAILGVVLIYRVLK